MVTITLHSKNGDIKTVETKNVRPLYEDRDETGKLVNVYERRNLSSDQCHDYDYDEIDIITYKGEIR
jgi:hypothetical protein